MSHLPDWMWRYHVCCPPLTERKHSGNKHMDKKCLLWAILLPFVHWFIIYYLAIKILTIWAESSDTIFILPPSSSCMAHFCALHGQRGTLPHHPSAAWHTSACSKCRMAHFHALQVQLGTHPRPPSAAWHTSPPSKGSVAHFGTLHGQRGTLPRPPQAAWNNSAPSKGSIAHFCTLQGQHGTLMRPPRAAWHTSAPSKGSLAHFQNFSGDMRGNGSCLFFNFKGMHAMEKTSECVLHLRRGIFSMLLRQSLEDKTAQLPYIIYIETLSSISPSNTIDQHWFT